jgi:hypothetical protein
VASESKSDKTVELRRHRNVVDESTVRGAVNESENVDRIRDILFGGQMRAYEQRFRDLETRMDSAATRLRGDLETRVGRLEAHARSELEALSERLQVDRRERLDADAELANEVAALGKELRVAVSELEHRLTGQLQSLRAALHQRGTDFDDSLRRSHEALDQALQRHVRELGDDKVGHEGLADMFGELALRLRGDFRLPEHGGDS